MRLIMGFVGQPSEDDLLFITDSKVKGYVKNIGLGLDAKKLSKLLPYCEDKQLIFLLE